MNDGNEGSDILCYLYRITNVINGKVYIGQTIEIDKRWKNHKRFGEKPHQTGQYLHYAMKKHGTNNFIFEVIATCRSKDDADETERELIKQYQSINSSRGYNLKPGGMTAGHSENTKQKLSAATLRQISEKGHPSLGTKRTEDVLTKMGAVHLDVRHTPEAKEKMSKSQTGKKQSKETVSKRMEAINMTLALRKTLPKKCSEPGCDVEGKATYLIVNGARFCDRHGARLKHRLKRAKEKSQI